MAQSVVTPSRHCGQDWWRWSSKAKIIQGIRNALVLLGNASQQHLLQQRKAILQHFNPQLKSLVQDADFAEAPPYLFGTNFGKLAKERLEAAALIQKAQKPQNFQKRHPQKFSSWGHRGGSQTSKGPSRGRVYHSGGSRGTTSSNNRNKQSKCTYAQFKCTKDVVMYSSVITSPEPCSTPPGVDEQVRSDRLSVSHKESSPIGIYWHRTSGFCKQCKGIW